MCDSYENPKLTTKLDIEYSTVLAVLYASYVPAQIPSNMVIRVTTDLEVISIDLSFVDLKSDIQVCIAECALWSGFSSCCCRPSYYIPTCVILWGLTSALTGVSTDNCYLTSRL